MPQEPRALIVVRLSSETETSTSLERQAKECAAYCTHRGWQVAGMAEDFESASRSTPWQRPQLSSWLGDRAPEFDIIVVRRLDRLVRKVGDLHDMTFAERWQGKDGADVTSDLVQAGITVECHPQERGGHVLRLPDDLRQGFVGAPSRPERQVATVSPTEPATTATTLSP